MDKQELRNLIYKKFGDQIRKMGVDDINFDYVDKFPSPSELPQKTVLNKIGKIGEYVVWSIKATLYTATVFVTLANMPEAFEKSKIYYPKTYEVAERIVKFLQQPDFLKDKVKEEPEINQDSFFALKRNWVNNK